MPRAILLLRVVSTPLLPPPPLNRFFYQAYETPPAPPIQKWAS